MEKGRSRPSRATEVPPGAFPWQNDRMSATPRLLALACFVVGCSKTGDAAREPATSSDAAASTPLTTAPTVEPPVSTGGGPVAPIALHHDNSDASTKGEKPSAAKCTTDADCRMISSYCQATPCTCYVLGKNEPERKCTSDRPVNCLVDPCQKKHAKCKAGACTMVGE